MVAVKDVDSHVADEVGFRAERHPAHRRVQPVGADHQVEPAGLGAVEGDADPVLVLVQGDDRVVEQELGVVPTRLVQDRREVAARQFHLAAAGRLL